MDCSTSGFPVLHHLQELAQINVHWVGDAIQSSHPLSSPSPPALSLSKHQGLFQWISSSHQVAKGLEFQLQHQSFQWTFRTGLDWFAVKGLPWWLRQLRTCLKSDIPEFDPWIRKIPWRREWQPTWVFLPGEFQWTGSPRGHKESDTTQRLTLSVSLAGKSV